MAQRTAQKRHHRNPGEGSITPRGKDAQGVPVWEVRAPVVGYNSKGQPIQPSRRVHGTQAQALRVLDDLKAGARAGRFTPGAADSFGAYLAEHVHTAAARLAASTTRRNRTVADAVAAAPLGAVKLRDVGPADLRRFYAAMRRQGATESTLRRYHAVIARALAVALSDGLTTSNPAQRLGSDKPVAICQPVEVPTDDEVGAVLGAAGPLFADLFLVAASTGLRRGEVCALRWEDIDTERRAVNVRHAIECLTKRTDGRTWGLKDPKTHQRRTVPLALTAANAFDRRYDAEGAEVESGAFIFSETDGAEPVHPDRVTKVFGEAARTVGSSLTLKSFRSYAATVIARATDLGEAAAWLGHKYTSTTERHYVARRTGTDTAAFAIDAALTPKALGA